MIPNQILSQSLLREVNKPENEGPFSKPTVPYPTYQERDILSRLKEEDTKFESMRFKQAPNNIQKMNEILDLKRKRDIKPTQEDEDYQKLLKQLEYATARNAQYKQDMNMIDTALEQLDPKKKMLVGTDIDKKFAYESLRSKRMQIREKEKIFLDQLQQFHDYYALNERNRVEKGIVNEDFLASKKDKIRDLKLKQEQMEYDKTNFLDQFDKIRSGYSIKPQPYFTSVGASALGLGGNPSYLAIDYDLGRVRDKLQDDTRRIEKMKSQFSLSKLQTQIFQENKSSNLEMEQFMLMFNSLQNLFIIQQDNMYYYTKNHLPVDAEEAFGSNKVNFRQEIKYLMETNKYAPTTDDKYQKLKQIRENLEKLGEELPENIINSKFINQFNFKYHINVHYISEKGLNVSKVKLQFIEETPESIQEYQSTLRDIENLRQDYIQSGGTDPEFLMNLQNLEQFYKQTRFNPINKDIIRQQNGLPIQNSDPPGFFYNSTFNGPNQMNTSSLYNQIPNVMANNSLSMGRQQSIAGLQSQQNIQSQILAEKYNQNQEENTITNHPIYEYLPETFKKQVVELEQKNKSMRFDLSSVHVPPTLDIPSSLVDPQALNRSSVGGDTDVNKEEQMLNYVRGQEAELLLNMSRLNPNQVEYSAKHSQFLQVQQMKAALEKSILDKKVKNALSGVNQTMNQSVLGNVSIVNGAGIDSSMNVVHLSRASTMYSPNEGFMLRFDWVGSLPINYGKIKLNFGIFRKGDNFFAYRDTNMFPTEQETYRSNKCIFLQKEVLRDVQPFPDTVLYVEFWGFQQMSEGIPSKPEVIGWSLHELFDYNGNLNPGKYRLPFYSKVFQPNQIFNEGLPYMSNSALFIRVCLPMDPYFDVDSTVLLQNEYRVQDLHVRRKTILKLDENSNQYVPDISNRYMYNADKNNTMLDPNQSSLQNQDQSTMIPNYSISNSKPTIVRDDNAQKPPDFSQFGPQSQLSRTGQDFLNPNIVTKSDITNPNPNLKSSFHIKTPSQSNAPSKRNITIIPSNPGSEISRQISSTSIEVGGLTKLEQPRSLRIRLLKLINVKNDVKIIQIRSVIFQRNEIVLTRNKNPSADNVKLDDVTVSKTFEVQMNVQMSQDIDWKEIMQKQTKRDLEKVVFYCAIFKCVVGKEDELLGWLVWPIYKVENDIKQVNTGVFTTNIFKKPAQKPPFSEKKEKSEIQMQFEIEAVGAVGGDTRNFITKSSQQINIGEEDEKSTQNIGSTKMIDLPQYENEKKLIFDLHGLQKYTLTKNDLQYRIEVVKDTQPIVDENGHKCIEQQDIQIVEKGRDTWKFDSEQKFEIGQLNLIKNFSDGSHSKGFIMVTLMTKDKGDVVGVAKIPLFQTNSNQLSEGRSKQELVKIEKGGVEKPLRFLLDYTINYINIDQLNKKVYDPSKGLKVLINELTNYREKLDVTYQFHAMIGQEKLKNNYGQPCEVAGQDFVPATVKEKKVVFKDSFFIPLDLEKIKDFHRKRLDEIYLLFEIIVDKSEGKGNEDIEVEYAWYAHPLFINSKPNIGRFNEQIYKLPKEIEVQPIDPKKMKKFLIKLDFEISEETGQMAPQSQMNSTHNQLVRSKTSKDPSINLNVPQNNDDNKFNIYIDQLSKIKFKQNGTTKLAIMFVDDIFPNDKGQPCSFTGDSTKPKGDTLDLTEEYDIDIDLEILKSKYPKQLDQFVFFVNILDDNSKPLLWFTAKIFEKGQLREGQFTEPMFEPPILAKLSQGLKSVKKSTTLITYEVKKGHTVDQSYEEV